ncbi:IS1-like element transposase [Salmonirosea aquatica]
MDGVKVRVKAYEYATFTRANTFKNEAPFSTMIHGYVRVSTAAGRANGQQNFHCKDCRKQFQFEYRYPGTDPRVKRKVCEMALNCSGIRDTARVLIMNAMTVIAVLRLWFKTHGEPDFEGTYQSVMIDAM